MNAETGPTAGASGEPSATARDADRVSRAVHVLAALWVVSMLLLAARAPSMYDRLVEEDRWVEWATVGLFLAAGTAHAARAFHVPGYRVAGVGVAVLCLFVAGEEVSWGQRLIGFTPPTAFLEHNAQQELSLHNFSDVFGRPKWSLAGALLGYGVLLPLATRLRVAFFFPLVARSAPPLALVPWFLVAASLLVWYPVRFTGEWVEALAGGLFFAAARPAASALGAGAALAALLGVALTAWSAERARGGDAARVACARLEANALLLDLRRGGAARGKLLVRTIHKRVWTMDGDGYLELAAASKFVEVRCEGVADPTKRRRYAIDPWGTAYWIRADPLPPDGSRIEVYSFGPNRRRDGGVDDVSASAIMTDEQLREARKASPGVAR